MLRATFFVLALGLLVMAGGRASAEEVTVEVGDFFFCSASQPVGACETVVSAGDTVRWVYNQGTEGHTVTDCGASCSSPTGSPLFDSGAINTGGSFSFTFETPGRYLYYCVFHPPFMQAAVLVQAQPATEEPVPTVGPVTLAPTIEPAASITPSPSGPTRTGTPGATRTATVSSTVTPLLQAEENDGGSDTTLWLVIGGALVLAIVAAGSVLALRRNSRV